MVPLNMLLLAAIVQLLIDSGAKLDGAMEYAIVGSNQDVIDLLTTKGAEVDPIDGGNTMSSISFRYMRGSRK